MPSADRPRKHPPAAAGRGASSGLEGQALSQNLTPATDSGHDAAPLTCDDAERLTERIRLRLNTIADNADAVVPLIEQARAGDAHQALGYPSWIAYVSERFRGTLGRLDRSTRQPLVLLLAEQGMSTRAIGSVVGASKDTVSRDLRAGVSDETPAESVTVAGSAGFFTDEAEMRDVLVMADVTPDKFEAAITEARADDDLSRENVVAKITSIKKIAGLDGKSYPRPAPREREKSDRYSSALVAVLAARRNLKKFADDVSGVEFADYEREGFNSIVESLRAALDMIHAGVNSGTWDDELANLLDGQA